MSSCVGYRQRIPNVALNVEEALKAIPAANIVGKGFGVLTGAEGPRVDPQQSERRWRLSCMDLTLPDNALNYALGVFGDVEPHCPVKVRLQGSWTSDSQRSVTSPTSHE